MVAYLDSSQERLSDDFAASVEAIRLGYIFSRNDKSHKKWMRERSSRATRASRQRPLSDAALEAAIMNIANLFPDNVTRGTLQA